jgi:hypothetical protein
MPTTRSSIEEHNAEEIAMLQRWQRRVALIYYASIIEMPIAVMVPCIATGIINMNNLGLHGAQMSQRKSSRIRSIGAIHVGRAFATPSASRVVRVPK